MVDGICWLLFPFQFLTRFYCVIAGLERTLPAHVHVAARAQRNHVLLVLQQWLVWVEKMVCVCIDIHNI